MKPVSRVSTALLLFLAFVPAMSAEVVRKVPEKFIGDWCTTPQSDPEETGESDISISEKEIGYYMDSGKILAAAAVDGQLALLVEVDIDGDAHIAAHQYDISADGQTIDEGLEGGVVRTRRKCKR